MRRREPRFVIEGPIEPLETAPDRVGGVRVAREVCNVSP
jgi:hypothetical protein